MACGFAQSLSCTAVLLVPFGGGRVVRLDSVGRCPLLVLIFLLLYVARFPLGTASWPVGSPAVC